MERPWKRALFVLCVLLGLLIVFDLGLSLGATCEGAQAPKEKAVGADSPKENCSLGESLTYHIVAAVIHFIDGNDKFFVAAATVVIAAFTVILAVATLGLQSAASQQKQDMRRSLAIARRGARASAMAAKAAKASADVAILTADHIPRVERAYLTGGGPVVRFGSERWFRIEVENHGKTPAYLRAFDVHFSTLDEVRGGPQEVFPMRLFDDRIKPGAVLKPLDWIQITRNSDDVVYGAFFYEDLLKREHIFRFILRIDKHTDQTHVGISGVDGSYTYWD